MSILKLKKVVIILDEFKNNINCDDRLYELLKNAMDNQAESIKEITNIVEKVENMNTEAMLTIDESNKRMQETFNTGNKNWRIAFQTLIISICILILGSLAIYFMTPFQAYAKAESTAISNSSSKSTDNNKTESHSNNKNIDKNVSNGKLKGE